MDANAAGIRSGGHDAVCLDPITLTDTQQPRLTFFTLNKFREQQEFCDIEIRVGEAAKFNCHQLILCASSPYIKELVLKKPSAVSHISLSDSNLQVFAIEMLLDFMYTSVITVNLGTVKPICYAAKVLKLVRVEMTCCKYILKSIKPDSCVNATMDHLAFALTNGYHSIRLKCVKHITRNLDSLGNSNMFLSLTADKLYQLLNAFDSCSMAEMLMVWVDHDRASRQQYLKFFIKNLRIAIPSIYDEQLKLKRNVDNSSNTITSGAAAVSKVIYVAGGDTDESITAEVEMYSPREEAWTVTPNMCNKKSDCALVSGGGQLYVIGGFDGFTRTLSMEVYNPVISEWTSGPSLGYARSGCGAAVFRGEIYVVGGYSGTKHMSSVEVYNLTRKVWSMGPSLVNPRSYLQVAVVNDSLYAVGGADDNGRLNSVEVLTKPYTRWIMGPLMTVPRSKPGVACINDTLYVCGGYNGENHLSSIESLVPQLDDQWTQISNMTTPRNSPGVCAIGQDLYIFGGYNGRQFLDSVEIYHTNTKTWSIGSPMMTPRCDFGHSTSSSTLPSITV